jgi:hypothetical protein
MSLIEILRQIREPNWYCDYQDASSPPAPALKSAGQRGAPASDVRNSPTRIDILV